MSQCETFPPPPPIYPRNVRIIYGPRARLVLVRLIRKGYGDVPVDVKQKDVIAISVATTTTPFECCYGSREHMNH